MALWATPGGAEMCRLDQLGQSDGERRMFQLDMFAAEPLEHVQLTSVALAMARQASLISTVTHTYATG